MRGSSCGSSSTARVRENEAHPSHSEPIEDSERERITNVVEDRGISHEDGLPVRLASEGSDPNADCQNDHQDEMSPSMLVEDSSSTDQSIGEYTHSCQLIWCG